jgi:DNA-binding protein HU-beta
MDQDSNIVPVTDGIAGIPHDQLEEDPLYSSERALMKRVYSERQRALINKNRTTFRKAMKHATSHVRGEDMTKAAMIEKMAKDANISKAAAAKAFDSFLGGIKGGLKTRGSKVTIVGFGTFKKVYRKTSKGKNPQTGEQIKIKGRNAVTFKASKKLV